MSPISDRIEHLARVHNMSALELLEEFLERSAIREHLGNLPRAEAEQAALEDLETYVQQRAAQKETV